MAKSKAVKTMSKEMMAFLEGENLVLLATVEAVDSSPNVTAISWVKPVDEGKIRFAVTSKARMIENMKQNPHVIFTVIMQENVYSIKGSANILADKMEGVAMPLAKVEVSIIQIFESMFWGAAIIQEPKFEKTYDPIKAKKLDDEVYAALLK